MNTEIKQKWVEALRSGKYKQGKGRLKEENKFCCLGVLCDIVDPNGWKRNYDKGDPDRYWYILENDIGSTSILPTTVLNIVGLTDSNPTVIDRGVETALAILNDHAVSFNEIADIIEDQL